MRLQTHYPPSEVPLREPFRYALFNGGKKLRPLLVLWVVEMLGGSIQEALDPALALELVHTFSLVHDDLPCMDDDDFRRGRPSLHKAFDEATAVLTGDLLLSESFRLLVDNALRPEIQVELIRVLTLALSERGLLGGQKEDLDLETKKGDIQEILSMYEKKTGALMMAAFEFGALIAESYSYRETFRNFGRTLGIAFQVRDDIRDATLTQEELGKAPKSDEKNNKSNAVTLLGLSHARLYFEKLIESLFLELKNWPWDTEPLSKLLSSL